MDLAGRTEYRSILAETIEETTKIIAQVNNPVKIIFFNGQWIWIILFIICWWYNEWFYLLSLLFFICLFLICFIKLWFNVKLKSLSELELLVLQKNDLKRRCQTLLMKASWCCQWEVEVKWFLEFRYAIDFLKTWHFLKWN